MSNYPSAEEYTILYSRYFNKRSIHELIDQVPTIKNKLVIDICCGGGDIGIESVRMGAHHAVCIDSSLKMLKSVSDKCKDQNIYNVIPIRKNIKTILKNPIFLGIRNDCVFCRQAINYWLTFKTAEYVASIMSIGGYFIFNTFNTCPLQSISYKKYKINNRSYLEVNQMIGNMIHHSQFCDDMPPHHTTFKWIPREMFMDMLNPHFSKVTEIVDGKTSIYVCVK